MEKVNYKNPMEIFTKENSKMVFTAVKALIYGKIRSINTPASSEMVSCMDRVFCTIRVESMRETSKRE